MSTFIIIIGAIICFGLIVFAHELGHFLTALWNKIPVEEFAMGMGPLLFTRERKGIRYSLRLLPIGAYVRLVGDEESKDEEARLVYQTIPVGKRIAMTFAGPLFNFILAVFIFSIICVVNGIASDKPIIGQVRPDSIAQEAGFMDGDMVLSVDGVKVELWTQLVSIINVAPERELLFVISRADPVSGDSYGTDITVTPERSASDGLGRIGIIASIERYNILGSFRMGLANTVDAIALFYTSIYGAIRDRQAPELIGPVGIIQVTGEVAKNGLSDLLWFMGFISINLGVVNLLPVPPLDGARILLMTIEKIRGKPLNPEREGMIHFIGYICLLSLIAFVTFGDIWRIFSN